MFTPALPLASLLQDLSSWPRTSQEQARRNAMVAATACARRRVERLEAEAYVASLAAAPEQVPEQVRTHVRAT